MKRYTEAEDLGGKFIAKNNKIWGIYEHLGRLGALCFRVSVFKTLNIKTCISEQEST